MFWNHQNSIKRAIVTLGQQSPDVTQYYKNITSPIGAIVRIQRDIQV